MGPSWVMKEDGASVQNVVLNMDKYVENYNNVQYGKLFGQLFGKCPCAFRLSRLAQTLRRGVFTILGPGFSV